MMEMIPDAAVRAMLNLVAEYLTLAALVTGIWLARGWQKGIDRDIKDVREQAHRSSEANISQLKRLCERIGLLASEGLASRRENTLEHVEIRKELTEHLKSIVALESLRNSK